MIISCPNCNKKFKIDQNLIPISGRLLQCSNCKHKWHFKIEKKDETDDGSFEPEKVIYENKNEDIKINSIENDSLIEQNLKKKELKKKKIVKKTKKIKQNINQNKKEKPVGLLNMIIIIIISFVAIVIVLDTFRIEISKYMPFLNPIVISFFEIIDDINSFIKDLIR
ncbi:zinc-ribbon domain-containing protein [Candidatus Pelagibacter sp.]|nr:zinc-ribbon domain-containing protein [Candidatus Pelagibacter sp.]